MILRTQNNPDQLRDWILEWLAKELQLPRHRIRGDENLQHYRMDSVNAIMLVGDLEDRLGLRLPPTLVWDFPTVDGLVEKLAQEIRLAPTSEHSSSTSVDGVSSMEELDAEQAQALLDRLDELSDAEVDALLQRLNRE